MSDSVDLNAFYQDWLKIPADRLPPNHYALLGVDDFETDVDAIADAAKARGAYLHQIAAGPNRKAVQEMLGKVALARRTLLKEESKTAYDQSLRQPASESATEPAATADPAPAAASPPTPTPAATPETAAPQPSASPTTEPFRRKRKSDWKYHGISAGVLLVIVAIIFFVNRGGGGRRAAEVNPGVKQPTPTNVAAPKPRATVATPKRKAGGDAPARKPANRGPQAPRKPSGIGIGMNNKFADVLSEISSETDQAVGSVERSEEFRPLGGMSIDKGKKLNEVPGWAADLKTLATFPDNLQERFTSNRDWDWCEVVEGQLRITGSDKKKNEFVIDDSTYRLGDSARVAMQTSVIAGMSRDIQFGFDVDGIRIGLRSQKNAVEIIARDKGASKIDVVARLNKVAQPLSLAISGPKDKEIQWVVWNDDVIHAGALSSDDLPESCKLKWFVRVPKGKPVSDFWLADYRTAESGEAAPE